MFTINAVVPLFMLMAFGYLVRQKNWLPESFMDVFNKFCFDFALPCSLFRTAYNSNIKENFSGELVAAVLCGIFVQLLLLWLIYPRFVKDKAKLGSMIQGAFRTNSVIFGLALGRNLFGETGMLPVTIMVAISVPTFNVIAVIVLAIFGDQGGAKVSAGSLLKGIASNRLILGTVAGFIFSLLNLKLPQMIMSPVGDLAATAGPLAMMALGAQFSFQSARKNLFYNAVVVLSRLIIVPLVAIPSMIWLGFRGPELGAMFILFASPTATSSYVMAKNMGCDGELAGEIVVFSTFFSVFTIFGGVYLLRALALI